MGKLNQYLEAGKVVPIGPLREQKNKKEFQPFVNAFFQLLHDWNLHDANKDLNQLFLNEMYAKFKEMPKNYK